MATRRRPPHEPTAKQRETVSIMTAAGITQEKVARCIGIDLKTLRKHYREELDTAAEIANAEVARSLYEQAVVDRSTSAAIWWTKARMGWKETVSTQSEIVIGNPRGDD